MYYHHLSTLLSPSRIILLTSLPLLTSIDLLRGSVLSRLLTSLCISNALDRIHSLVRRPSSAFCEMSNRILNIYSERKIAPTTAGFDRLASMILRYSKRSYCIGSVEIERGGRMSELSQRTSEGNSLVESKPHLLTSLIGLARHPNILSIYLQSFYNPPGALLKSNRSKKWLSS